MRICIQVHPKPGEKHLPPNLGLTVLNKSGDILDEVASRKKDELIQLRFEECKSGDSFIVKLPLGDVIYTKPFKL